MIYNSFCFYSIEQENKRWRTTSNCDFGSGSFSWKENDFKNFSPITPTMLTTGRLRFIHNDFNVNRTRQNVCSFWFSEYVSKYMISNNVIRAIIVLAFYLIFCSCKGLIEVDPPITNVTGANVYNTDATAKAVLTNIYADMSQRNNPIIQNGITSISVFAALSADELSLYNLNDQNFLNYYRNDLNSSQENVNFWNIIYPVVFVANSAIEGLDNSTSLTPNVKMQLLGEAKFIRSFLYFYLVNLYADVPLVKTTNYKTNSLLSRSPKNKVYEQIIEDLKEAQGLLSEDYLDASLITKTNERVRPTKWAATALLARAYLYNSEWANAEAQSTMIINNVALYDTVALNDVFLKNSKEAIWQLQPVGNEFNANTGDGKFFILPETGPSESQYPVYLDTDLVNDFENLDRRRTTWIGKATSDGITYYYPFKYKIGNVSTTTEEYIMVMRLAEQYLIRAEARAHQGKISEAASDLNVIRSRAGLSNTTAITQAALLNDIFHERKVELFTEWGHRWFDLKRTADISSVMGKASLRKGGVWDITDQLYPIPITELSINPHLVQNGGY